MPRIPRGNSATFGVFDGVACTEGLTIGFRVSDSFGWLTCRVDGCQFEFDPCIRSQTTPGTGYRSAIPVLQAEIPVQHQDLGSNLRRADPFVGFAIQDV
jgi:hypothetical protein